MKSRFALYFLLVVAAVFTMPMAGATVSHDGLTQHRSGYDFRNNMPILRSADRMYASGKPTIRNNPSPNSGKPTIRNGPVGPTPNSGKPTIRNGHEDPGTDSGKPTIRNRPTGGGDLIIESGKPTIRNSGDF